MPRFMDRVGHPHKDRETPAVKIPITRYPKSLGEDPALMVQ